MCVCLPLCAISLFLSICLYIYQSTYISSPPLITPRSPQTTWTSSLTQTSLAVWCVWERLCIGANGERETARERDACQRERGRGRGEEEEESKMVDKEKENQQAERSKKKQETREHLMEKDKGKGGNEQKVRKLPCICLLPPCRRFLFPPPILLFLHPSLLLLPPLVPSHLWAPSRRGGRGQHSAW